MRDGQWCPSAIIFLETEEQMDPTLLIVFALWNIVLVTVAFKVGYRFGWNDKIHESQTRYRRATDIPKEELND